MGLSGPMREANAVNVTFCDNCITVATVSYHSIFMGIHSLTYMKIVYINL